MYIHSSSSQVYVDGDGNRQCCFDGTVYSDSGRAQDVAVEAIPQCSSFLLGTQKCCTGTLNTTTSPPTCRAMRLSKAKRAPVSRAEVQQLGVAQPKAAGVQLDEKEGTHMVKRDGHHRTVLSAKLVAEHLANNGVFHFNDERIVDHGHVHDHSTLWNKAVNYGVGSLAKFVLKPLAQLGSPHWLEYEFIPLSQDYDFRTDDIPEIAARLMGNSSFERFFLKGVSYDRVVVRRLIIFGSNIADAIFRSNNSHPYILIGISVWWTATADDVWHLSEGVVNDLGGHVLLSRF